MRKFKFQTGYTLTEVMIVITIIGILATVAIPSYLSYVRKAHSHSCLLEAKGYSNQVFYDINDQDDRSLPLAPAIKACRNMTDATGWTLETQQKIVAVAKSPSNARIECDIPNGTSCIVLP